MKTSIQKKSILVIAMLILVLSGNFVQAQQRGPKGPPPIPSDKEIAKMVTDLSKELSLSEKQEAQVSVLYVTHYEEVSDKMESGKPSRNEMEKLKSELEAEVKDNLTDAQVTKYDAYLKNASSQNSGRRPEGR